MTRVALIALVGTAIPRSIEPRYASPPQALAIAAAVGFALFAAAVIWMVRAQLGYLRRIQTVRNVRMPYVDKEWYDQYVEDPLRFPIDAIGDSVNSWNLIWRSQPEPELEQARKRVVFRIWLVLATMIAVMVGFIVVVSSTS